MLVEVVYQYRALLGKCDLGLGLDWDEMEQISQLETSFAPIAGDRKKPAQRKFRREAVRVDAILRGDQINDRVDVIEIGPGGLVCRRAPFIARDEQIEIVIEEGDRSFRFRARGVWLRDDGDDYKVGLAFIGMPVCLHKVQVSAHEVDMIDKIAAAA